MAAVDTTTYRAILRLRKAYPFMIGGLFMCFFQFMCNLGILTMLTLSGFTFFQAGTVSSVIALATFLIGPQVSRMMDERGQRSIAIPSGIICLVGIAMMVTVVELHLPFWLCYIAAALIGFIPNAGSMNRARWTYLAQTGKMGDDTIEQRSLFSFQGVLDDVAFMIGPALSITLAASVRPTAGMIAGGICFIIGLVIMSCSRSTEPAVGWVPTGEEAQELAREEKNRKPALLAYPILILFFILMLSMSAMYAIDDESVVAFSQAVNFPQLSGIIVSVASLFSMLGGLIFGVVKLPGKLSNQLLVTGIIMGILYAIVAFAVSPAYIAITFTVAGWSFAPFFISLNTACEKVVPSTRLTESLTWMNSGMSLGSAFGPTLAGIIIDAHGYTYGFLFGAIMVLLVPIVIALFKPILKRHLDA